MKSAFRAFKNEWNDYCEGERVVRELTSNGEKEPSLDALNELAYLMQTEPENYQRIFLMIMRRVTDYKYWKHVEKGLTTVEHLLKYGNSRFVCSCKAHLNHFQKLQTYKYHLKEKEYGENVRRIATEITRLLLDAKALKGARARAQQTPRKLLCSVEIFPVYQAEREQKELEDARIKALKPRSPKKSKQEKEPKQKRKKPSRASQEEVTEDIDTIAGRWLSDLAVNGQFQNSGTGDDGGVFEFDAIDNKNQLSNIHETDDNNLDIIQSYENNPFSISNNSTERPAIDNLMPFYGISTTVSPSLNTSTNSSDPSHEF